MIITPDQITIVLMGGIVYSLIWVNHKHLKIMKLYQDELRDRLNIILRQINDIQIEAQISSIISPSHEPEENDVHGEEPLMLRSRRIRD